MPDSRLVASEAAVLKRLVEQQIGLGAQTPSPVETGEAVRLVLGESPSEAGILGEVLPWWRVSMDTAQDARSQAHKTFAELSVDLLGYMVQNQAVESVAH